MKRLIVLSSLVALIGTVAWGTYEWDTGTRFYRNQLLLKVHFTIHRDAFDELDAALAIDPPLGRLTFSQMEMPRIPDELLTQQHLDIGAQNDRYAPVLKALKFPGAAQLQPGRAEGTHGLLLEWSEWNSVELVSMALHSPDGVRPAPVCPSNPLEKHQANCAFPLGGNWWHYFEWTDLSEFNRAMDACEGSGETIQACADKHRHLINRASQ